MHLIVNGLPCEVRLVEMNAYTVFITYDCSVSSSYLILRVSGVSFCSHV